MHSLPVMPAGPRPTPPPERTHAELRRIATELTGSIEGEVRFDLHNRMLYATDASLYQVRPLGVVIPANVEDAVRAVEFCAARNLPILPRGGGTSLAGQCVNNAVVIDFSAGCRAIRSIDAAGLRCDVEPGITVDELNDVLARDGIFFAPDPATSRQANIGGCIGNNAAGGRSILFGRTSENLLGLEAAVVGETGVRRVRLKRGASRTDPFVRELTLRTANVVQQHAMLIRERFPKTIRRNAGYNLDLILQQMDAAGSGADADEVLGQINLAHLLCGSEGTLAATLGAQLKLTPLPRSRGMAVIGFASLEEAIDAVVPILQTRPSAVELLDDTVLDLASANAEYKHYVELMPCPAAAALRAVLYVEYFSSETARQPNSDMGAEAEIRHRLDELRGLLARAAPSACMVAYTDPKSILAAWKLRKAGEPLLHGMPGDRKPITFVEDNAVPVENLSCFVREFRAIVHRHGTSAAFWAHASVGVLHVRPFLDIRNEEDRRRMQAIAVEVADLARSLGGVMSGEHGDGRARGPLLERFYGPELMRAFRQIKAIFDPSNLLNPGNLVEPGPIESIVESIRVKPAERFVDVIPTDTYFNYDDQHGFRGAVEMCNGAGVCRKKSGGTMCPSYMGTLDERHSTRGRGNALRLAITGQLAEGTEARRHEGTKGAAIWDDPGTLETLDLCLSCKACKAECPSNVDIARLKAEYTAQRYRTTGRVPLAARAFGHVRLLNQLGSLAPGIANWTNRQAWMRAILKRALGLAPERSIPEFARSLSRQWASRDMPLQSQRHATRVVLFGDCFMMYNEPGIGLATRRVLEAFGYEVILADAGCCGRALISTGLLENAIATLDATLERLRPHIEDSSIRAILVAEPSCLSAFKDDWLQLKLRSPLALRQQLAAKSYLPEDFLDRHWDSHSTNPKSKIQNPKSEILLHAHCHQKALWGADSSAALLRRICGQRLQVLDTGCCGMAGSFGYTANHYDLSMRIGELMLFPAVRATPQATVIAPGTSCRHQIHDGTHRRALHPMEYLAALLGPTESARPGPL
jgi:FAD/FMN-containing dehydrogenase/Fe-S oxidoreductase